MEPHYDSEDPLAIMTAPPPSETPAEKAAREEREAKAQRVSDQIDEQLRSEWIAFKEQQQMVKVLLLGQRGSGKSTLVKFLRMQFAPFKLGEQERAFWRTVLQLNLVQSVNKIITALQDALDYHDVEEYLPFSDKHRLLQLRLQPFADVEVVLKRLLRMNAEGTLGHSPESYYETVKHDDAISRDVTEVIASCKNEIMALWEDHVIREMLERGRVRLDDTAIFFLDNAERIAIRGCETSYDDIQEYELNITSDDHLQTWKLYKICSSRTQRHAWLPYFDQVNAIIFLAPVSCFDERLQEDPRVNRLEDSFILWKAICSSKLLTRTTLVVFLTKIDILAQKIASGMVVKEYLPSYGDRPNDTESVVKYLRQKFKDTVKYSSPEPRVCHIYRTSVIDSRTTSHILLSVRDGIIRAYLRRANLC